MRKTVLVVEDSPEIVQGAIQDTLVALDHDFVVAGTLEEARKAIQVKRFDYVLLDLSIPVRQSGTGARKENGLAFLDEVRKAYNSSEMPVCAITSYTKDAFNCATELARLQVNAYAAKPFDDRPLIDVITTMLRETGCQKAETGRRPTKMIPFKAETREVVVYENVITVCGEVVWTDTGRGDAIRKVFLELKKLDRSGVTPYIKGVALETMLGRNASNKIGRPIKTFRDSVRQTMESEKGLSCGLQDVIGSHTSRGYFLQPWISLRIVNSLYAGQAILALQDLDADAVAVSLTDRQMQVLARIAEGDNPNVSVLQKVFKKSRSVINKDLKVLRDNELIQMAEDGTGYKRVGDG